MAKVNAKVQNNTVATVNTVAQSVAPAATTASATGLFAKCKYTTVNGTMPAATAATAAAMVGQTVAVAGLMAQMHYNAFNVTQFANNAKANKTGNGCTNGAKQLGAQQNVTATALVATLHSYLLANMPKSGQYGPIVAAYRALPATVTNLQQAQTILSALAWAWGYVNGGKGQASAACKANKIASAPIA